MAETPTSPCEICGEPQDRAGKTCWQCGVDQSRPRVIPMRKWRFEAGGVTSDAPTQKDQPMASDD